MIVLVILEDWFNSLVFIIVNNSVNFIVFIVSVPKSSIISKSTFKICSKISEEFFSNLDLIISTFKMRLLKILGYMPNINECVSCGEKEKLTDSIEIMKKDYKRVINKFNTLAQRYTRIKNVVEETMYKAEQVQIENYELKQKNKNLKKEVIHLKDYIDKTFEYVSLLVDFSKDRLKRLVKSFINNLDNEKYK